ncbi:MAG: dihydrolipoyl dehydrogenase [Flavobacteriaceae bacterium]|nr:dihydrolipoyl dehydrogenase [Flavobacteriaceae bacterium]|tara:strand:+ start:4533 stop:5936 length:1404 start_codon:yes stop_codon:yes gene_type:complete
MNKFDVVVIGSGPGGYVCAIRCSQLGFKTALVEKYNVLGGTCLNVGCIPSKSLLDSSHHYYDAKNHFQTHGILIDGKINVDFEKMISRKKNVVDQTTKGIDYLMKKNNIHVFYGHGSFIDNETLGIENDNKSLKINFEKAVIATGSKPSTLPFVKIDKKRIITSTQALDLNEIPKKLLIIGAGVIGLELGQVYSRLGSEVKIIEYADKITPFMDSSVSKELIKIFKKQKISFFLSHEVKKIQNNGDKVLVDALDKDSNNISFTGDYCLVSVGRKAYTDGLGLENIGLNTDKYGKIIVNDHLQTDVDNIYAIGDVIKGPMLAHKAEEEGILVAEILSKQKPHIDYNLIPNVIYTWPEVASVGKTEEELSKNGIKYKTGQFPMRALGRSRASMDLDGFVKILADKKTDEILGVHIIGARAADLIAEAVTAMEFRASAEDVSRMSHSHPTYAEAIKEAALAATEDRALHI